MVVTTGRFRIGAFGGRHPLGEATLTGVRSLIQLCFHKIMLWCCETVEVYYQGA